MRFRFVPFLSLFLPGALHAAAPVGAALPPVDLRHSETPRALVAEEEGGRLFDAVAESPPAWLYSREWNMMRPVGRGLGSHSESFSVRVTPESTTVIVR